MGESEFPPQPTLRVGRYTVQGVLARGGMATVHVGRLLAEGGFARTVAIKRLHSHLAHDPEFVTGFLDEARLCARIRHPNVVPTLDVVSAEGEVWIVMEYVEGLPLSFLSRAAAGRMPLRIASAIMSDVLRGLHAAHEATDDQRTPLRIVHRDVSPQNVLTGVDGISRVIDFGIAKAISNRVSTQEGQVKGKLNYMAPEQVNGDPLDRRTDLFAASVVLWELITGARLFEGETPMAVIKQVFEGEIELPSMLRHGVPPALDAVVMRGLSRDPAERFQTALEMEEALEAVMPPAPVREVAAYVREQGTGELARRADTVRLVEDVSSDPAREVTGATAVAVAVSGTSVPAVTPPTTADAPAAAPAELATRAVTGTASVTSLAPPPRARPPAHRRWTMPVVGGVLGGALLLAVLGVGVRAGRHAASSGLAMSTTEARPAPAPSASHEVERLAASASAQPAATESAAPASSAEAATGLPSASPSASASPPRKGRSPHRPRPAATTDDMYSRE